MQGVTTQGKRKGKIRLVERLRGLPAGTLVPAQAVLDALANDAGPEDEVTQGQRSALPSGLEASENPPQSWRILLWTVPAECRIGREELLEAVGRPRSWIYRQTAAKADNRIPHRKFDGELVFIVGEVRQWLKDAEEIVQAGPLDSSPRLRAVR